LGIDGTYRTDLQATDSSGREVESDRSDYGVFVDLNFVRLHGKAFRDTTTVTTAGVPNKQTRDGIDAGVSFYF